MRVLEEEEVLSKEEEIMEGGNLKKGSSKDELFHVIHKVPPGDTPYVRAKYAQVISFSIFLKIGICYFSFHCH